MRKRNDEQPIIGISKRYIEEVTDEKGQVKKLNFKNTEGFNFAYDILDVLGRETPDRLAMLWLDRDKNVREFTFGQLKKYSDKTANYLKSMGIKKGDRVILVLKRHYQFWFVILALHKLGAVAIPATHQLKTEDFSYRFSAGDVDAVIITDEDDVAEQAGAAIRAYDGEIKAMMTGTAQEGWVSLDKGIEEAPEDFEKVAVGGDDPMVMFFTSGTTGQPKIVTHDYKYPLAHYVTAKLWQNVDPYGIHFTVSDTGWGKALWGKLYGQWICEAAVFVYDMEEFVPYDFLGLFDKYPITTFCAPPTAYRVFVKRNLEKYGISKLQYATTAGEALNPEVWQQFYDKTGLKLMEGFGQTETTLVLLNMVGSETKPGSMGRPGPVYDVDLIDSEGNSVATGETGEVVIRYGKEKPLGLFVGYYGDPEQTEEALAGGVYHTGDTAYRDEDGYFWYVGRTDDLIKSCGYRVGPFEVESVLMELPYVLECAVTGIPDKHRGQLVKATIVLTKGTEPGKELEREIIGYAKKHMAHFKCPRKIEFVDEMPKTISGKVRRVELREKES